jgi:hypothetical protein
MVYERGGMMEEIKGTTIVDGIRCGHLQSEVEAIKKLINHYKVSVFVEVGVHEGGLSYQLIPWLKKSCLYVGVEINCQIVVPRVKELFTVDHSAILFCKDYRDLSLAPYENAMVMVYCDNGNKAEEMKFLSPLIKTGDAIMCHDYCDSDDFVYIPEIGDYGKPDVSPKPEVHYKDLEFLRNDTFKPFPKGLLNDTRLAGFVRTKK